MKKDGQHLEARACTESVVDVTGGDFVDLVACPFIDWTRCYSNDLHDVQSVLGIYTNHLPLKVL